MLFQSHTTQSTTANPYAPLHMPQRTNASQLKIVSFNIWDLPYWFIRNRKQRILQIAEYLRRLDAEIVCLQESFDVHHRRVRYEYLCFEGDYGSGGLEETGKAPFGEFYTTGGLVFFKKSPLLHSTFFPFHQF